MYIQDQSFAAINKVALWSPFKNNFSEIFYIYI